ncbi:MAG: hypothetical protein NXY59_09860 [Aigarchaeota archaeon]|nr:hypothetical protein [Candidatus Pelearchaeum maunauluense]
MPPRCSDRRCLILGLVLILVGISAVLVSGYRIYSTERSVSYSLFMDGLSSDSITYIVGDGYYIVVEYFNISCGIRLRLTLWTTALEDGRPGGGLDCQNTQLYIPIWEPGQPRLASIKLKAENFAETAAQIGIRITEYRAQTPYLPLSLLGYIIWIAGFALLLNAFIRQTYSRG